MSKIREVGAIEILDSRGQPTIEVWVQTEKGAIGQAAVPSGASTGAHEAHELRDGDAKRFHGKGVLKAIDHVRNKIGKELLQFDCSAQVEIDQMMIKLDGTENKKNLGANAMLGVSLAVAKAAALEADLPLFKYVSAKQPIRMPLPMMNVINGGAHADNGLDVQEFMLVPTAKSIQENVRMGSEIFITLKKILQQQKLSTGVGDEGGFAPKLSSNQQALDLLMQAIEKSNYKPGEHVKIALDVAATELYSDGTYRWEGKRLSGAELTAVYSGWCSKYPIVSIEDGWSEDDWTSWQAATKALPIQLVGDDLFVTNSKRLQKGIDSKAANALLVKVNQIGTLTETIQAVRLAQQANYKTIMSHRSGETEDSTISHLAVGLNSQMIKTGSVCRGERTAKYNELLRIANKHPDLF